MSSFNILVTQDAENASMSPLRERGFVNAHQ